MAASFIDSLRHYILQIQFCKRGHWAEYSYRAANILIQLSFLIGVLPLKFRIQDKNKMQFVESKFHYLRWKATVGGALLLFAAITARFIADVSNGLIKINDFHSLVRIFIVLGSTLTSVLRLHTLWRIENLVEFINFCVAYYEGFQGKLLKGLKIFQFYIPYACTPYILILYLLKACPRSKENFLKLL
jgi:hypothetical protein